MNITMYLESSCGHFEHQDVVELNFDPSPQAPQHVGALGVGQVETDTPIQLIHTH